MRLPTNAPCKLNEVKVIGYSDGHSIRAKLQITIDDASDIASDYPEEGELFGALGRLSHKVSEDEGDKSKSTYKLSVKRHFPPLVISLAVDDSHLTTFRGGVKNAANIKAVQGEVVMIFDLEAIVSDDVLLILARQVRTINNLRATVQTFQLELLSETA